MERLWSSLFQFPLFLLLTFYRYLPPFLSFSFSSSHTHILYKHTYFYRYIPCLFFLLFSCSLCKMDANLGKAVKREENMVESDDDDDGHGLQFGGGGCVEDDHHDGNNSKRKKDGAFGAGANGGCGAGGGGGSVRRSSSGGGGGGGGALLRCCQAEKCTADLSDAKQYHKRHKVCEYHAKAQVVLVAGIRQRFCQQCSRFHELSEFDESKRSCRRRLAGHNERRRKNTAESQGDGSSRSKVAGRGGSTSHQLKDMICGQVNDHHKGRTKLSIQENANYKPFKIR